MTERSRFWDGTATGDATEAPYDAATEFAAVMMAMTGARKLSDRGGVWDGVLSELAPTSPSANTLRIAAGSAQVYGTWYESDANVDTNIPTPGGATRIDRIVLRKSWASQTVRVTRIAGAEGGSAPNLTQTAGTTWDVPLCQVSITTAGTITITDQRVFLTGASNNYNYLTNPGFEVWQRGAGPFTTNNVHTADRWLTFLQGSTVSVTRENVVVPVGSLYSLKVVYTHVAGAGNQFILTQKIEDLAQLRGRTVTFSVQLRQNVASAVRLQLAGTAMGNTPIVTSAITDSFVTLSITAYVPTGETTLTVNIQCESTVTFYVDNAVLAIGRGAEYTPLHPAEEYDRCLRYYEVHGGAAGGPSVRESANGAHEFGNFIGFNSRKIATPSLTKNGTWAVVNCAQPTVVNAQPHGYEIFSTASAAGPASFVCNSADDTVTAEANP